MKRKTVLWAIALAVAAACSWVILPSQASAQDQPVSWNDVSLEGKSVAFCFQCLGLKELEGERRFPDAGWQEGKIFLIQNGLIYIQLPGPVPGGIDFPNRSGYGCGSGRCLAVTPDTAKTCLLLVENGMVPDNEVAKTKLSMCWDATQQLIAEGKRKTPGGSSASASVPPLPPAVSSTFVALPADFTAVSRRFPLGQAPANLVLTEVLDGIIAGYKPGTSFEIIAAEDVNTFRQTNVPHKGGLTAFRAALAVNYAISHGVRAEDIKLRFMVNQPDGDRYVAVKLGGASPSQAQSGAAGGGNLEALQVKNVDDLPMGAPYEIKLETDPQTGKEVYALHRPKASAWDWTFGLELNAAIGTHGTMEGVGPAFALLQKISPDFSLRYRLAGGVLTEQPYFAGKASRLGWWGQAGADIMLPQSWALGFGGIYTASDLDAQALAVSQYGGAEIRASYFWMAWLETGVAIGCGDYRTGYAKGYYEPKDLFGWRAGAFATFWFK